MAMHDTIYGRNSFVPFWETSQATNPESSEIKHEKTSKVSEMNDKGNQARLKLHSVKLPPAIQQWQTYYVEAARPYKTIPLKLENYALITTQSRQAETAGTLSNASRMQSRAPSFQRAHAESRARCPIARALQVTYIPILQRAHVRHDTGTTT